MINVDYAFDDEVVSKFSYDLENKVIEVYYPGYIDIKAGTRIEEECVFAIKNWSSAKSKFGDDVRFYDLDKYLGIFSMIIHIEYSNGYLSLIVNTINDTYITLKFEHVEVYFKPIHFD